MVVREVGYLAIICIFIIISAGCIAPPSEMSGNQNISAEPIPAATVSPAATPAAIMDSVMVEEQTSPHEVIYSEKMDFLYDEVSVVVELPHPPLIINLDITPETRTRIKEGTSIYGEKKDYRYLIEHVGSNVWFECTVKDADTGIIVARDGFGRTFSQECRREIIIRRPGNYTVTFNGNYVGTDILMTNPRLIQA
ncbi:hypothetical protein J2T58_000389 [Methanocalculus alkaliphilus]|uniref:hypothetical protein n=1 Tax=Methanocalculus alkaliphilus TaxID=768730 RepID=UPI00209F073D|nr:hypothetical protein [Methanocalculus alkaliphilus]MCP1714549.1 hypothetical protein [Methanocalculus alkaliphilus]